MPSASPVGANGSVASPAKSLAKALALLEDVLRLVDAAGAPAQIGALVQTAHDELERYKPN